MLMMLVQGYFIYCVFFQTAKIFNVTYNSCSKQGQGFGIYLFTRLFVLGIVSLISLSIGFIASIIF